MIAEKSNFDSESNDGVSILIGILVLGGLLASLTYMHDPTKYWDLSYALESLVMANTVYLSILGAAFLSASIVGWWKVERLINLTKQGSRLRRLRDEDIRSYEVVETSVIVALNAILGFGIHSFCYVDTIQGADLLEPVFMFVAIVSTCIHGTNICRHLGNSVKWIRELRIGAVAAYPELTNSLILGTEFGDSGKKKTG